MKFLSCTECGRRISLKWLLLAMPWSNYTCAHCSSVFAGTLLRTGVTSLTILILGYVLIQTLKGGMNPVLLVPAIGFTAAVFLLNLPHQLKTIHREERSDAP